MAGINVSKYVPVFDQDVDDYVDNDDDNRAINNNNNNSNSDNIVIIIIINIRFCLSIEFDNESEIMYKQYICPTFS